VRALPKVSSKTFLTDLKAIGRYSTEGLGRLSALPSPASEAILIASLVAKGNAQNKLAITQAIPAVERGNSAAANRLLIQVGKLGDQYNAIAVKLGAKTCAVNPTPSA
jgi:hypothetical protein